MLDKNVLKNWFKTKAKPTQSQFWQWIDASFFHGEKLDMSDVNNLEDSLSNLQIQINANAPNELTSGGTISILVDDGEDLKVHLSETAYKLNGATFSTPSSDYDLSLRPESADQFRIDLFYLDESGLKILTGEEDTTPITPTPPNNALILGTILIGFDNVLEPPIPTELVVLEFDSFAFFPPAGVPNKIYVDKETEEWYRWDDDESEYIPKRNQYDMDGGNASSIYLQTQTVDGGGAN